jgi:hypothetical protein
LLWPRPMKTRPEQRLNCTAVVRRAVFVASKIFDCSGPLEQAVTGEPTAIAISGISSTKKRDVEILELDGKYPSYENVQSGNYLYIVSNESRPNAAQIKDFIQFAGSRAGREVIRNNGTVAYLEDVNLMNNKLDESRQARQEALIRCVTPLGKARPEPAPRSVLGIPCAASPAAHRLLAR